MTRTAGQDDKISQMATRRRSTAPRGRNDSSATLSRRRSQQTNTQSGAITPTFALWILSCVLLIASALMHFSSKAKTPVVPVLKHDQTECAQGCWVSDGSKRRTVGTGRERQKIASLGMRWNSWFTRPLSGNKKAVLVRCTIQHVQRLLPSCAALLDEMLLFLYARIHLEEGVLTYVLLVSALACRPWHAAPVPKHQTRHGSGTWNVPVITTSRP